MKKTLTGWTYPLGTIHWHFKSGGLMGSPPIFKSKKAYMNSVFHDKPPKRVTITIEDHLGSGWPIWIKT